MINHNGYYEIDFEDVRQKVETENIKLCILLIRIIQQVVYGQKMN